jgi:antitoxin component of MazEF toxin-antitoxin module
MRTKLVKIGNSRGLRLAKPLLEQDGLTDEDDIQAAPASAVLPGQALHLRAPVPPSGGRCRG